MPRRLLAPLLLVTLFVAAQELTGPPAVVYQRAIDILTTASVEDHEQALDSLRRIARDGHLPASYALGTFYESGSYVVSDPAVALTWYKRSAAQGDRLSQWAVGRMYLDGIGMTSNRDQAVTFLQRSADQGDPFGAYLLAVAKLQVSDPDSFAAFRRAAQLGSPQAQQKYAEMLASGKYGMPNRAEAYTWAVLSVAGGNDAARTLMSTISGELDSKTRDAAAQRAADLAPSVRWDMVSRGCTGWDTEFSPSPAPPPARLQEQCRRAGASG